MTAGRVGPGEVVLRVDGAALEAGARVLEEVEASLREIPSASAIRKLARLSRDFPDIVLRAPEFVEAMGHLLRRGEDGAVRRIVGEARRGRRVECQFYLVALMDRVIEAEGCSRAAAAKIVFARYGRDLAKGADAIENDYSRYKGHYDLWRAPKYVPEERLTRTRWGR